MRLRLQMQIQILVQWRIQIQIQTRIQILLLQSHAEMLKTLEDMCNFSRATAGSLSLLIPIPPLYHFFTQLGEKWQKDAQLKTNKMPNETNNKNVCMYVGSSSGEHKSKVLKK